MKHLKRTLLSAFSLIVVCNGCSHMTPTDRGVVGGGLVGAGTGAIIGDAVGNPAAGALIGTAVGAISGGMIGNSIEQSERRAEENAYQRIKAEQAVQRPPLSMSDVINLAHNHVSDALIIQQIRETGAMHELSANDIIMLKQQGVSDAVVQEMQRRRGVPVVQRELTIIERQPPPPRVSFGIGYYGGRPYRYHRHPCGW